jgi:hypothetical protein
MEISFRKIKNTGKSHLSRQDQLEDKILGYEDKADIIGKTDEYIKKRVKKYE